ncbi:MAG: FAD-dependent oxidoreductase [Clostridia bacterium]|nr:FAD-dependent oxidoreductase [Clostridia bacterium]
MGKKYDLIVVGGGFAGTAAAVEAAEKGLQVLLVEKYNCLGGAAVNCLVLPFMKYWTKTPETKEVTPLTGSLFLEIVSRMGQLGGCHENRCTFDEEVLKLVLNRMCIERGVELLFNATVTGVDMDGKHIRSLRVLGKSKVIELQADHYIDATGDAELSMLAGCRCNVGRESDGLCQPMTLCFRVGNVNTDLFYDEKPEIIERYKQLRAEGKIKNPRHNVLSFMTMHDGIIHFNTTRIVKLDPTDPFEVTRAEIEAREQVYELMELLKTFKSLENSFVLSTALQIGIRESRKVLGEYTLTVEDLKSLACFEDAIAVANYDIDIHNPEGSGTSHYFFGDGEYYQIPYRCLIPRDCENLLVAGRCISSTHEAQASYRIMPYCCELGQAAGAAVSVAVQDGTDVRGVDIGKLQEILRSEQFMI